MGYRALYREWRPAKFSEVIGQENITSILKNQIESGRISHAYLFCGARGTGKTSTAKIFARVVCCHSPKEGNACEECESCIASLGDGDMDIIEIDAASNNGVNEIRELRDKARYAPMHGRYKVYIIDEVHMLSGGAFNALLKTLEEPPPNVVFILATTEPQKLPATVLSRCQRYDFKRIGVDDMIKRMKMIAIDAGINIEDDALDWIARAAEGGMRDALSLLDQCISLCGDDIKKRDVLDITGAADASFMFDMAGCIIDGNAAKALGLLDSFVREGRDISVLAKDIAWHFRTLLIAKVCGEETGISELTNESAALYAGQAAKAGEERILRALNVFPLLENAMRYSSQPRIALETALVGICRPETLEDISGVLDRLDKLEKTIGSGVTVAAVPGVTIRSEETDSVTEETVSGFADADDEVPWDVPMPDSETPVSVYEIAEPDGEYGEEDMKEDIRADNGVNGGIAEEEMPGHTSNAKPFAGETDEYKFAKAMQMLKEQNMPVYIIAADGKLSGISGDVLEMIFPDEAGMFVQVLEKKDNMDALVSAFEQSFGKKFTFQMKLGKPEEKKDNFNDILNTAIALAGEDKVELI